MNILSINCGGIGQVHKQSWIRDIIHQEKLSVIGIQETKMEQIDQVFVNSIWTRDNVDFAFNGSIGASGGTLTIWNTSIFDKEGVLVGSSFSGAFGKWRGVTGTVFLINIYAPQEDQLKEELWDELSSLMESRQGVWILFGDLNAVRYRSERAGSNFNSREASAFNEFITRNGLFDFPMGGRRFTRFSKNGEKMSKLDRFLVSQNFLSFWPDSTVTAICRVISDHCPILLKNYHRDYGPRPFRIFDFWTNYNDFDELVSSSWCAGMFSGTDDIRLKNKIKSLKADIKAWSIEKRLKDTQKTESLKRQLVDWDQKAEAGQLSAIDVENRDEVIIELHKMDQEVRDALKQKSRIKWAIEGDENSSFFHALLKSKGRKNSVNGLICDGVWTDDPTVIKDAIIIYN